MRSRDLTSKQQISTGLSQRWGVTPLFFYGRYAGPPDISMPLPLCESNQRVVNVRTEASHCCDKVQVAWDVHLKALESFTATYGSVRVLFLRRDPQQELRLKTLKLQENTHSVGRSHDQLNASSVLGHSRTRVHIFSAEISRILLRAISSCGVFLHDI